MVILLPTGADPADERWFDRFTDEEIVDAYLEAGYHRDYGELVVAVLRGQYDGPPII